MSWKSLGTAVVAFGLMAVAGCKSADRSPRDGALVVWISSDLQVPKDLTTVTAQIVRNGVAEEPRTFDLLKPDAALPLVIEVRAQQSSPESATIRVGAWKGNQLRVFREATAVVPVDRREQLIVSLQWLCDGQVVPGASLDRPEAAGSSCDPQATCVLGRCGTQVVEPSTLKEDATGIVDAGSASPTTACLDVAACLGGAPTVLPRSSDCSIDAPVGGVGLNVALALPTQSDGVCDSQRCLIAMDGFSSDLGWVQAGTRIVLPPAVCTRLADGRLTGVVASSSCPTKTVSIAVCGTTRPPVVPPVMPPDAGVSPSPDGGGSQRDAGPTVTPVRDAAADVRADAAAAPVADAAAMPMPDDRGLIGHWRFDEPVGSAVLDSSGDGNHGTVFSGANAGAAAVTRASRVPGKLGTCLSFNGTADQWVAIPRSASIDSTGTTGAVTVAAWVFLNQPPAGTGWFVRQADDGSRTAFGLGAIASNAVAWIGIYQTKNDGALPVGRWVHVSQTYDGFANTLYVEGKPVASMDVGFPLPSPADAPLTIGSAIVNQTVDGFIDARIDEVRLYNRALRADEVAILAR